MYTDYKVEDRSHPRNRHEGNNDQYRRYSEPLSTILKVPAPVTPFT